jgi:trigger factor
MKIEVTELEPCKLSVHYEANFMEIGDKRAEVETAFKKAPVPGFRPGKATPEVIRVHYRQQIDDSVKRALAEDAFHNTLFEKKLRPHGAPRFNSLLLDGGKFTCEFELFTKPDFEAPAWKDMEIPMPPPPIDSAVLAEKMMQELRVRLGDVTPYSEGDFVQAGDNVIIDYEGSVDGEVMESLVAQGEMVTIGQSPLVAFDNNLLGMTMGETREFDFVSPEGGLPSLSGKTIHFKVTLNMGSKTMPCALDDEMAKKMGKADFAELQQFVAQAAFARSANSGKMAVHEAVAKKLVADTKVDVPHWMSLSEAQYLAHQSQLDWNVMSDSDKERLIEMASQNVKLSLVLDKIRELEPEAQLSDQEVFEIIKQNLANTKVTQSLDEVIQQMNKTGYLQILFSRIRDENAMDFVVKHVKLIE